MASGVDVLEQLELPLPAGRLQHRHLGMVAIETDCGGGPFAADLVTTDDGEAEVGEECDRRLDVPDGDSDVLEFDGHARHGNPTLRFIAPTRVQRGFEL